MRSPARLRERSALEAQLATLRSHANDTRRDFCRGATDALRWLAEGGPSPLSGCLDLPPVTMQAIVRELAGAEDIIYGKPSRHRDYCRGLEHALMWAQFATAAPPLPANSSVATG